MGGAACCQEEKQPGNFTFLTRSISFSRLGNDLQLNQQGLQAEILAAVQRAELRKKNQPVNIVEIWQSFELNASMHSSKFKCILFDLFKQGEVIADQQLTYWSTNLELQRGPQNNNTSPFMLCSDMLAHKFPSYEFDSVYRIVPKTLADDEGESARVANFDQLKEMLLRTVMTEYEVDSSLLNERVFLDGTVDLSTQFNQVAIQSFEEAGNSALGKMIEEVTGVFVGSDANIYQAFDKAIGGGDLGELHTSSQDQVWFTKTNHPMESKPQGFNAQKMIVVVRNPSDVIRELADSKNLFATQNRLSFAGNYNTEHKDWWNKWVSIQSKNMAESHEFIMKNVVNHIPTYFVRYEDLLQNPTPILMDVFKIVLGVNSLEGTILERRIEEVSARVQQAQKAKASVADSADLFDSDQLQLLKNDMSEYLDFFKYKQPYMTTGYDHRRFNSTAFSTQDNQDDEGVQRVRTNGSNHLKNYLSTNGTTLQTQGRLTSDLETMVSGGRNNSYACQRASVTRRNQRPIIQKIEVVENKQSQSTIY